MFDWKRYSKVEWLIITFQELLSSISTYYETFGDAKSLTIRTILDIISTIVWADVNYDTVAINGTKICGIVYFIAWQSSKENESMQVSFRTENLNRWGNPINVADVR